MAGYKLKTHKGAAKRFKFTASGRVKNGKAFASHLLTSKSAGRMRKLSMVAYADKTNETKLKRLLPYN